MTEKTKDGNMIPDAPLDRARILEEKIRRALSSINLELETVSVNLDEEHNDTLSLRIRILPEAIMTPDEVKVDTDFQQIIKGFKDDGDLCEEYSENCTKCWNSEIEDYDKEIFTSIDNKLTFNKLEFSPISDINLDDANEDGLKESLKRNDYVICAHNSFDYNKIPIFIKWLQDVYDYCTELKNKVEYVDFNTAKLHMYNGNKAKLKDCIYYIEDEELYFELYSEPRTTNLSLSMIESNEWILL